MTHRFAADTRAVVLTISDRCHRGQQNDLSGPAVARLLHEAGIDTIESHILPDELDDIVNSLHLHAQTAQLVTTGGTGLAARDVTRGNRPRLRPPRRRPLRAHALRRPRSNALRSSQPRRLWNRRRHPHCQPPRQPCRNPSTPPHALDLLAGTSHDPTGDISHQTCAEGKIKAIPVKIHPVALFHKLNILNICPFLLRWASGASASLRRLRLHPPSPSTPSSCFVVTITLEIRPLLPRTPSGPPSAASSPTTSAAPATSSSSTQAHQPSALRATPRPLREAGVLAS